MAQEFNVINGWVFWSHKDDGTVVMEKRKYQIIDGKQTEIYTIETHQEFDTDTWASIVAHVSANGESTSQWLIARGLHLGEAVGFVPE